MTITPRAALFWLPPRVSVPVPFLVSVTWALPKTRSRLMSPAPPTVKLFPPWVRTPVTVEAVVVLLLMSAPWPSTPRPAMVKGSETVWPLRSRVAPALTVVAPAAVPSALGWARRRTLPALTVAAPVKSLNPARTTVPSEPAAPTLRALAPVRTVLTVKVEPPPPKR